MSNVSDLGLTQEELTPGEGWHCSHFFYSFDRTKIANLRESLGGDFDAAKAEFVAAIEAAQSDGPARFQIGLTSGHKADFSLMLMDPDPIKIESVHQQLISSTLGQAIQATWSYVSISEISEYALSVEQYAERLRREGMDPESSAFQTKIAAYGGRVEKMNFQRLTPHFADWPVSCFYPMNKWRLPGANWFALSSSARHKMMSEHARSGIKFAGKVTQLITVGVGLDDWEWGVTLWATNPKYLKDIVYEMRFDEASAKYAEFGPFYTSYKATPEKILKICRI